MNERSRRIALLVAGVVLMGGLAFAFAPPRVTLLNSALRIDYPWTAGTGAAAAGLGAFLCAAAATRRWIRALIGLAAVAISLLAVSLLVYRLEAGTGELSSREWLGRTVIPWGEVGRVNSGPEKIVVWGTGDTQVRIETGQFRPEQRATIERAIARLVRQAANRS